MFKGTDFTYEELLDIKDAELMRGTGMRAQMIRVLNADLAFTAGCVNVSRQWDTAGYATVCQRLECWRG